MKIRKGDQVLIISGKERGKKGKILRVFPEKKRIVVEGINMVKKHERPKRKGEKGQIVEMPSAIDASNVKIICGKCGKTSKVGYKMEKEGKRRICRKCGKEI